jgi:hypothetical protein
MELPCYEELREIDISPYCGVTQSDTIRILFNRGLPKPSKPPKDKKLHENQLGNNGELQMLAIAIIDSYTPRALHQGNVWTPFWFLSVDPEELAIH